jgi:predicted O-methyltransferase YrrM
MMGRSAWWWLLHLLRLRPEDTQLTQRERACLVRHAAGRRRLVEIGVMHGATTALLRTAMDPSGILTGIDPHLPGRLGVSFELGIARRAVARQTGGRVRLLRGTSEQVAADWTESIDLLFIDGDHSWAGIAHDWTAWSPFVEGGGIVALHDSRSVAWRADADSVRYTQEIVLADRRFSTKETVDSLTIIERVEEAPA